MFLLPMFLAHVFSPRQGAQCGPADKHLSLCFFVEWANKCVTTEEKNNLVMCIYESVRTRAQIIFFPVMYFRSQSSAAKDIISLP